MQRIIIGIFRYFTVVALTLLGASVLGSADPGYLPIVGPAPLRFRRVLTPAPTLVLTPRPPVTELDPVLVSHETLDPLNDATNISPVATDEPPPANLFTNAVLETPSSEEVISPQMLLRFFSKTTNGARASVTGPINFTPPQPTPAPSSKATYSISP